MDVTSWIPVIVALIGGGWLGTVAGQWYGARRQLESDLRATRLRVYADLWALTSVLSTWPRTDAGRGDVESLHHELRRWYYGTGGMHMSENARARYGDLQKSLDVALRREPPGTLADPVYAALRDQASLLRTALTEDLETRVQSSPLARRRVARRRERYGLEAAGLVAELSGQKSIDPDRAAAYPPALKVASTPVATQKPVEVAKPDAD